MSEIILTITLLIWVPLIPLRLIIQGGISLWRRLGDLSYICFFLYWAAVDIGVLASSEEWGRFQFSLAAIVRGTGWVGGLAGLGLAYWTARTLGFITFSMRPQMTPEKATASLIVSGPYRFLRHPFYFAEWLLLAGLMLLTESWIVVGLLIAAIVIDPIVTWFEEKELVERFGDDYREYQRKVPRLFPLRLQGGGS